MLIDPNTRFEAMADVFYRDTGQLAPGKDAPQFSESQVARKAKWHDWLAHNGRICNQLFEALEKLL